MKIRVFKTPTKSKASRVHVGIPDKLKLDPKVSSIELSQTEIIPPPKTLADLTRKAKVIPNKPVNAFKNVAKSTLQPGYKMTASVKAGLLAPPIEVEEITIPDGFIHLESITPWEVYNYNKGYKITDQNFGTLPGDENLPMAENYRLFIKGREIYVKHDMPITDCDVFYKRIYRDKALESTWVKFGRMNQNSDPVEFNLDGEFLFRAVPLHKGKALAGMKQRRVYFEEVEEFDWDIIQLTPSRYQIRMEGLLGDKINQLVVMEKSKRLATVALNPDKDGRIEKSFQLNGISDDKQPEIDFMFYRVNGQFKSFIKKEQRRLYPKRAVERVGFRVAKLDTDTFEVYIEDVEDKLYTPLSSVSAFDGEDFQLGIQSGKLMANLQIRRHQDGTAYDYGYYTVNITRELEPKFLSSPPFGKLQRFNRGYKFIFEDTKAFREIRNLDDPNLEKSISYEFRLLFWSTGIEHSLRNQAEYTFAKETPIFVKNTRRSYKFNYNCWKEEHPRRKYFNRIPKDLSESSTFDVVYASESPFGFLHTATPQPLEETRNIDIEGQGWKVLYFYNDKDDEIQTFPYYGLKIDVPDSSKLAIEKIRVSIDRKNGRNIRLGTYHPVDSIEILDFIGYYDARKFITKKVNTQKATRKQEDRIARRRLKRRPSKTSKRRNRRLFSIDNTPRKKNRARKNNRRVNKAITQVIETGTLLFNIDVRYKDGSTTTFKHIAFIGMIPRLPPEPDDNQSVSIGNKTVEPTCKLLDKDLTRNLTKNIRSISTVKKSPIGRRR